MSLSYPPRLNLAQTPTPLLPMDRLSEQLGGPRIWIKRDDKTGADLSGNKIRKLEFTLAKALEEGCDTIITSGGVQSNHCRTTAILCAGLGLKCHLILREDQYIPGSTADGNLLLDRLVGARIDIYSNAEFIARNTEIRAEVIAQYVAEGQKPFVIPVGASDGVGVWGYIAASEELSDDFSRLKIAPGHIICATGSGGTQAGLTAGSALFELNAKVWGINVCDNEAYFQKKVRRDLREWKKSYQQTLDIEKLPIRVIDGYVGPGYAMAGPEVFDVIKRVASLEGVILDPVYTAKAFAGMMDQIDKGLFDDCTDLVFIHTGGVFGLFPQREALSLAQ